MTIVSIMYLTLVVLVSIKILLDTKSSSKALAYLTLVFVLPIFGILFYFAVGVNHRKQKLYQKKLKLDNNAYPELEQQVDKFSEVTLNRRQSDISNFSLLAEYCKVDKLSSDNNEIELLINGETKFPSFLNDIRQAKHHVHLEYYIYENDDIGTEIANLLIEKVKEGVEVRFIYDDFGSKAIRKKFIHKMLKAGVEVVPFYKINFIHFANRINYRNHRKILVVDGEIGYVGGINVSDKYYNNGKKDKFWRDTHLKIKGLSVLNLQQIFLTDWNFCAKQDIHFSTNYFPLHNNDNSYGNSLVQIVGSGPDSEQPRIMHTLIQSILLSKKEILITTPYFIPDKSFIEALSIAKLSGVDVKVLVPESSDSAFVNAACKSHYQEILEVGVELYFYTKGFIHAKTIVCDEHISMIGTANLDNRSFDLNFEVNAVVYDQVLAKQMKVQFGEDLKESKQVTLKEWKARPIHVKTMEKIVHLFAPLL